LDPELVAFVSLSFRTQFPFIVLTKMWLFVNGGFRFRFLQ